MDRKARLAQLVATLKRLGINPSDPQVQPDIKALVDNGQTLTSHIFNSPEEAIKAYGSMVVRVRYYPPPRIKPSCCTMKDDLVVEQVRPLISTELIYRLTAFFDQGTKQPFWRYVRD